MRTDESGVSHPDHPHLLDTFPADVVDDLIGYVQGRAGYTFRCVANAAAGVLRYALGRVEAPVTVGSRTPAYLTREERLATLEPLRQWGGAMSATTPVGINWNAIVLLVLQIIQELMYADNVVNQVAR